MGKRGRGILYSRATSPDRQSIIRRIMESTERFSSRTEGSEAHIGLPSLGSSTGKMSPQDGWV